MKINALNNFEKAMIKIIATYNPYSERQVEEVYRQFESYDKTIMALNYATSNVKLPQNYEKN